MKIKLEEAKESKGFYNLLSYDKPSKILVI